MTTVEPRTHGDLRAAALRRANEVRYANADLRATIRKAGYLDGAALAAHIVERAEAPIKFLPLLRAIPHVGNARARVMLGMAGIWWDLRVNSDLVTPRQRAALIGELLAIGSAQPGHRRRGQ